MSIDVQYPSDIELAHAEIDRQRYCNAKLVSALEKIIKLNDGRPDSEVVWIAEQALINQQSTEKP